MMPSKQSYRNTWCHLLFELTHRDGQCQRCFCKRRVYISPSTLWHVHVVRWTDPLLCSRSDVAKGRPNSNSKVKSRLVPNLPHFEGGEKVEPVAGTTHM
jgi:hypothetical protein